MKIIISLFLFFSFVYSANKIDVNITTAKNVVHNGKLVIDGRTNLPNGTKLLIYLSTGATSEVVVTDNKFTSDEFSDQGKSLKNGTYQITIKSKSYIEQPKNVQEIIGKDGINLVGKLIEQGNVFNPGNIIKYEDSFTLGTKSTKDNSIVNSQCNMYKKIFYGDIDVVKSLIKFGQTDQKDVCTSVKNVFQDEANINEYCTEKVITDTKEREALNTWYEYCYLR